MPKPVLQYMQSGNVISISCKVRISLILRDIFLFEINVSLNTATALELPTHMFLKFGFLFCPHVWLHAEVVFLILTALLRYGGNMSTAVVKIVVFETSSVEKHVFSLFWCLFSLNFPSREHI